MTPENTGKTGCRACRRELSRRPRPGMKAEVQAAKKALEPKGVDAVYADILHVYATHGTAASQRYSVRQQRWAGMFEENPQRFAEMMQKFETRARDKATSAVDPGSAKALEEAENVIKEILGTHEN